MNKGNKCQKETKEKKCIEKLLSLYNKHDVIVSVFKKKIVNNQYIVEDGYGGN